MHARRSLKQLRQDARIIGITFGPRSIRQADESLGVIAQSSSVVHSQFGANAVAVGDMICKHRLELGE
jgi:hypothetical protein